MNSKTTKGIIFAILAAALYAISAPVSKMLLNFMPSTMLAAFLYLGAGTGMAVVAGIRKTTKKISVEKNLTKKDLPYVVAMVLLDIAAPISLMYGLSQTSSANASLLNNFEIAATAIIALFIFKEKISFRLWIAILFITIASVLLSFESVESLTFSYGSLFVLLACVFWGFENNCTRKLSSKNPEEIIMIKGIFSGLGSLIIALIIGDRITTLWSIFASLILGFVAYGISIFFYVYAQRELGAAKTSAYYAIAPFIGVALSFIIFRGNLSWIFLAALIIMIIGAFLASRDNFKFIKKTPKKEE